MTETLASAATRAGGRRSASRPLIGGLARLVTSERRASWVYYRVVPRALTGLSQLLDATETHATDATAR